MLSLFFFASGFSALAYQIVWTRTAGLVLGNTTAAVGTVVAIFMAGLAAGSFIAGRWASRVRPLRLYGQIEIAVGLLGLAIPWLFEASSPLQAASYGTALAPAVRVLTCAVVLLPATVLMGATLPLLVQHADREHSAGRLYAVNSAGAALGALAAGLLLVPTLGLAATTLIAAGINVAVGAASIRLGTAQAPVPAASPAPRAPLSPRQKAALTVYAISGFAALVCEMAWTRALTLAIGSTVYAFSLILFSFIVGLAIGSGVAARRSPGLGNPLRAAAVLQLAIAAWSAGLVWFLAEMPLRVVDLALLCRGEFALLQACELLLISALVVPPTALMGALLPVTVAEFRGAGPDAGRNVGRVYAWNTVAAIGGSLAGSFLLLPALGIDLTLRLAVAVNVAAALLATAASGSLPGRWKAGLGSGILAVGAATLLLPSWQVATSASGAYLYAQALESRAELRGQALGEMLGETPIEAAYWDTYGLVTVHRKAGSPSFLRINGKTDAGTGVGDMMTQALLAHIPMLTHERPREVLVIGLGIGVTLAGVQAHEPERVDCVEISPAVRRAAEHFSHVNAGALTHPRTRILLEDGRAHVTYARQRYDVIISEPSNLWISGMANLFTTECFRLIRSRLEPGGIFAQWLHAYKLSPEDFCGVVRTFTGVFPHVQVWEMEPANDYLLIGSEERLAHASGRLRERMGRPAVQEQLSRVGIHRPEEFLAGYVCSRDGALALARHGRPITDDRCWIEHTAPLSMNAPPSEALNSLLDPLRRSPREIVDPAGADPEMLAELDRFATARRHLCRGLVHARVSEKSETYVGEINLALEAHPRDPLVRRHGDHQARSSYREAFRLQGSGLHAEALARLREVNPASALHAEARSLAGWCHFSLKEYGKAQEQYEQALAARPRFVEAHVGLSQTAEVQGRVDAARALLEEAVSWEPPTAAARTALARFLWRHAEKDRARLEVQRALRADPHDREALRLRDLYSAP